MSTLKLVLSLILILTPALYSCDDDSGTGNNTNNVNNANNVNNTNNTNNVNNTSYVELPYAVVDTAEESCYGNVSAMGCVALSEPFGGQDAQFDGFAPRYTDNGDGTVSDPVTGLMWVKSPDLDGDGDIDVDDKLTYGELEAYTQSLNEAAFGGYTDWRIPTIKELYSLILFSGTDPSSGNTTTLIPFIDTDYFDFAYGDEANGERLIDSQWATSSLYVGPTTAEDLLFGVNFADGRIKGYGLTMNGQEKRFYFVPVRGNQRYGQNDFEDMEDGTIYDHATGLMWSQEDSGEGLNWEEALEYAQQMNAQNYLGYNDWRLPNIKELHSITDYSRSPETTESPCIDPLFNSTSIINELGEVDWPYVWSSTTHASSSGTGNAASYVAFGKALGYMNGSWIDVHGAGAQRSDPKTGDPADYPNGFGPQGDAIRIYNYVRLVRDGATYNPAVLAPASCGDDLCDADETVALCPEDCTETTAPSCGDGECAADEDMASCPEDCTEGGPTTCTIQADCEVAEACPPDAPEGCSCAEMMDGSMGCIPNCNTADDCPAGPGGATMVCSAEGLCVPGM